MIVKVNGFLVELLLVVASDIHDASHTRGLPEGVLETRGVRRFLSVTFHPGMPRCRSHGIPSRKRHRPSSGGAGVRGDRQDQTRHTCPRSVDIRTEPFPLGRWQGAQALARARLGEDTAARYLSVAPARPFNSSDGIIAKHVAERGAEIRRTHKPAAWD